jgi:hypothetical protein
LSIHHLWEQQAIPIILTARKVKPGIRKVLGVNTRIRKIKKNYLFGFDYLKDGEFYLPYSDIEKTLIDFVVFKEKISKEVLALMKKRLNMKKVNKYLKAYSKKTRKKVMNIVKNP